MLESLFKKTLTNNKNDLLLIKISVLFSGYVSNDATEKKDYTERKYYKRLERLQRAKAKMKLKLYHASLKTFQQVCIPEPLLMGMVPHVSFGMFPLCPPKSIFFKNWLLVLCKGTNIEAKT